MLSTLPDELLLEIARHVVSQPALAALSQVSKHFYAIFTPFLYRHIWVDANSWMFLETIPHSHVLDVRSLVIGPLWIIPKDAERKLLQSFAKMKNLRSLTVPGQALQRYLVSGYPRKHELFEKIQDVTIRGPWDREEEEPWIYGFGPRWYIPSFQNLRSLNLLDIKDQLFHHNYVEISEVLLRSPELRELGLSFSERFTLGHHGLPPIIKNYDAQRIARGLPLLRLSCLYLGSGFLPHRGLEVLFDGEKDYLSMLTDLSSLETLRLQNYLGPDKYEEGDFEGIDPEIFKKAHHLRYLSIAFFTDDIVRLFELEMASKLAEISISHPYDHYSDEVVDDLRTYLDNRWRRIAFYGHESSATDPIESVADYPQVTELKLDIYPLAFRWFKKFGLSQLPNLEVLHFMKGTFLVPRINLENEHDRVIDLETNIDTAVYMSQAKEFFRINRKLVLTNPRIRLLRYVGFYTNMYTCFLTNPEEASQDPQTSFSVEITTSQEKPDIMYYQVRKLSMSEAILFEDIDAMALGGDLLM
ncbi:hypothetical protein PHISCL_02280 [Aspergillus sclerotialis]|uniref:F-box domain-containing protein n=1 Tax=Aspergillus sclerotialis TaxID=2070753 RepID=A0A3A2ZQF7_9EURO|nr:hypothetical protein PHISCL_02280 [Aspergillus sclerotialis]